MTKTMYLNNVTLNHSKEFVLSAKYSYTRIIAFIIILIREVRGHGCWGTVQQGFSKHQNLLHGTYGKFLASKLNII